MRLLEWVIHNEPTVSDSRRLLETHQPQNEMALARPLSTTSHIVKTVIFIMKTKLYTMNSISIIEMIYLMVRQDEDGLDLFVIRFSYQKPFTDHQKRISYRKSLKRIW